MGISMKSEDKDRASVIFPPPLIFFACLIIGACLEFLLPSRPLGWPWMLRIIIGGFLFLFSGYFALGAFVVLRRNKTPIDPSKPTNAIVSEGPFRFSRNPMYLSLLLLLSGLAVLTCSLWIGVMVPVLFFVFNLGIVEPEEKYLTGKFGDDYRKYKAKVRRWI